jgi:MFS family permease
MSLSGTGGEEFRRGWRVLLAASVAVACCTTVLPFNTLGAVIGPMTREFGWPRGALQLTYFFFTLASGVTFPFVGAVVDRIGARRVALAGMPAFALGFALISLGGRSLTTHYALWIAMGLLGAGATPVTFTRMVNEWFIERRGLALAITLVGAGLGTAVQQVLSTVLTERFGWRAAFGGLALLPLGLAFPLLAAYFRAPATQQTGRRPEGNAGVKTGLTLSEALRGYRFFGLSTAVAAVTLGISGTMINLKPLMADRGMPAQTAAYVAAAVGISVLVSRLGTGFLIDRIWAPVVGFPLFGLPIGTCVLLAGDHLSAGAALMAVVFLGLATGAEADLMPFLIARYFGLRHYGRIYGVLFSVFLVTSGIAPYLFGLTFDRFGNYRPALMAAGVLFAVGATLLLTLGRYPQLLLVPQCDHGIDAHRPPGRHPAREHGHACEQRGHSKIRDRIEP